MVFRNVIQRGLMVSLALVLGLALVLILLTGMAVAQGGGDSSTIPPGAATVWLVLDTSQPVDQTLPNLLAALDSLKAQGLILGYNPTPQSSGPDGVPGVQVAARPGAEGVLNGLPGVLYVGEALPPAPPEGIGVLATTVITGRVTEEISPTTPIALLRVIAFDGVTAQFLGLAAEANGPAEVSNGFYTVTVTSPYNRVKLFFRDDVAAYVPEWHNNKSSFTLADNLDTTAGGTITNVNAQLTRRNAAITGTVRFTPTNQPVNGANVAIFRAADGGIASTFLTGANGVFTFTNLAPDLYKIGALAPSIVPEFYQDVPLDFNNLEDGLAAASGVTLTNGTTQSIVMLVEATAMITGVVTDTTTSLPIPGAFVELFTEAGSQIIPFGVTAAGLDGRYQLSGFGSGNYKVRFSAGGYNPELYDNVTTNFSFPPGNISQATVVTATSGQTRTNINAGLTPVNGLITGTVTSFTGTALVSVEVELFRLDLSTGQYFTVGLTDTTASGEYNFGPLPDGSYKVAVGFDDDDIIPHAAEWFNNANVVTSATVIQVSGGISQTGKNVQLAVGGCLAGKIVDASSGLPPSPLFGPVLYQVLQVENGNAPISFLPAGAPSWTTIDFSSLGPPPLEAGEFLACGLPSGDFILDCDQVLPLPGLPAGQQITATVTAGSVTGGLVCKVGVINVYLPVVLKQ